MSRCGSRLASVSMLRDCDNVMNTFRYMRVLSSVLLIGLAALLFASCDSLSDFGDINTDPTAVSSIPPEYEFTTVQLATAGSRWETWRSNLIYSEVMVQHLATQLGYWAGNTYGLNTGYGSSFFDAAYYGGVNGQPWLASVKNVENLLHRLQESPEGNANRIAATRIWRVLVYQRLTDLYGAVPYFEAGQGYISGEFTPRYTPQDSIYYDLHDELRAAIGQFDASQETFGAADLVWGGDIDQWQRFANSLQLRLALRLIKVEPNRARQWFEEAANHPAGVMQSNDDMAYVMHQDGPSGGPAGFNTNANSEVYGFGVPRISKAIVDFMQERNDPRLLVYGAREEGGQVIADPDTILGYPNGYTSATIDQWAGWQDDYEYDDFLALNPMFRDLDDPLFFQTYAEVEFMLAEGAVRGWNVPGTAAGHFEEGIRAAMTYLELYDPGASIAATAIDDYIAENPLTGSPSEQLDQINTQYWAAILLHGYEGWANWRRSGYPQLDPAPVNLADEYEEPQSYTNGYIPRRLPYPSDELNLNTANFEAARNSQGIVEGQPSVLLAPVWWDCGATAGQCNTNLLGPQANPENAFNGPGDGPPGALGS